VKAEKKRKGERVKRMYAKTQNRQGEFRQRLNGLLSPALSGLPLPSRLLWHRHSLLFLPALLGLSILGFSCSSIDCPVQNTVVTRYCLMKAEGVADTLRDTMYVRSVRRDGQDAMLYNAGIKLTEFKLPIGYSNPEDTLFFSLHGADGVRSTDTIWIKKENMPHFESVDCSVAFFHTITAVRYTHYGLDSIVINNPEVTYDPSNEHFHIYIKDRR
jgi:hypothetical protein